jgi:hypothetical protein
MVVPQMLVVVHSGQTGVERGAHQGAIAAGLAVGGFCRHDRRDELGPLPAEIADVLTPCIERGPRQAVAANLRLAAAAIIVVPAASEWESFPAMSAVQHATRKFNLPIFVCDPGTNVSEVARWVRTVPAPVGPVRIAVTGPRATRWLAGEALATRIVKAFAFVD